MRPLVSYDDLAPPHPLPPTAADTMPSKAANAPPTKKRKTNNYRQNGGSGKQQQQQHWDDPGNQGLQMSYDEGPAGAKEEAYEAEEEEEESRELTHEEIWDDSVLIDAWNSAAAEYEAFHGPGKTWKTEPVKKSPLWYNVPPSDTDKGKKDAVEESLAEDVADSTPVDFDTFVPAHDPSLFDVQAPGAPPQEAMQGMFSNGDAASVSQDEAFSRAMNAMYWTGYYTAIYHTRRKAEAVAAAAEEEGKADDDLVLDVQDVEEEGEEDEDMIPSQR